MTHTDDGVTLVTRAEIERASARGGSFLETPEYRLGLARREAGGDAEVHLADTDIFHVLEGSAVIVTGGEMVEPREVAPNEIRAGSVRGGVDRVVSAGDVIVIHRGTPHWFREVTAAPCVYLVVKSTRS